LRKVICFALVGVFFFSASPARAEYLRTSLFAIELNPTEFYEKNVEIQAYFYKEDDLWVESLPESSKYVGFFLMKPQKDTLSLQEEYFGFVFAPKEIKDQIRLLRKGDKITLRGRCFEFKSVSMDGPGIEVSQLLSGWGKEARTIAQAPFPKTKSIVSVSQEAPSVPVGSDASTSAVLSPKVGEERYQLFLNGKAYQGLRFGDDYVFEGAHFRVEKEKGKEQ